MRAALQKAVDAAGGQRAFAREHGLSPTWIGMVLKGEDTPGPRLCAALGIEVVTTTTYRRKRK